MLGLALTELGRLDEAEAQYAEALRLHPNHAPTLIYMAQLMARTSRPEEAITHARRGVDAQPANVTYRSMLIDLLARAGRGAEAIEEARRLVELSPASALRMAEPRAGLASAALARGDAPEAVREAETTCTLGGYKVRRHVELLAAAYDAAGRAQDAQRARELAARLPAEAPR